MASSLDLLVRQWAPVNASENWRLKWKWKGWKHVNWNGKRSRRNWLFSVYNFSFFQLKAHEMPWESFGFLLNQMASCKMSSWHWQTRSFEVHWRLQRLDMAPSFAFEEFVGFCTSIWKRLCCSKSLFLFATFQLFGVQDGTFEISLSLSFSVSYIIHLLYQVVDSTWCTYCQCFMCFFVHEFVCTSVSSARPGTVNTTDTTDTTTKGTGTTGVRAGQNGVRAGSQGTAGVGVSATDVGICGCHATLCNVKWHMIALQHCNMNYTLRGLEDFERYFERYFERLFERHSMELRRVQGWPLSELPNASKIL